MFYTNRRMTSRVSNKYLVAKRKNQRALVVVVYKEAFLTNNGRKDIIEWQAGVSGLQGHLNIQLRQFCYV